jgi:hypothetical protein
MIAFLTFRVVRAHVIVIAKKARREPMKTMSSALAFAAALVCANFACSIGARAQDYPSHPITMIVPFPAGGPTDTLGRILGEGMRLSLGQPIIVENVTGAGSTIGVGRAAQAPPDGYTLSLGNWTSFVGSGALYRTSYDLLRDGSRQTRTKHRPLASVPAARRMCAGFISKRRRTRVSSSCPIAAARPRCRIWSAARSI